MVRSVFARRQAIRLARAKAALGRIVDMHRQRIEALKGRCRLKIGFVIANESSWKLETVLRALEADDDFDTAVVVPNYKREKVEPELARRTKERTERFFRLREGATPLLPDRAALEAFEPDIIFISNPHPIVEPAFYGDLFRTYPCCYVPYSQDVVKYNDHQSQFNQLFHNAMWRIFTPFEESRAIFEEFGLRKAENVLVTGYPASEPLLPREEATPVWKPQDYAKKKIIWAPHHTIDMPELPYANFLRIAYEMKSLADDMAESVQWAFKPHPLLRSKLYRHRSWGKSKTDAFFDYWRDAPHSQLEEGEYAALFRQSDAMVHDSGSFTAEYLVVDKPVMFVWRKIAVTSFFSEFGLDALSANERGVTSEDVRHFVEDIVAGRNVGAERRREFLEKYPVLRDGKPPSERIVDELRALMQPE